MANSIYQLCYLSQKSDGITEKDVENIVLKARDYNKSRGITGVLLFRSGIFIQLLEGDKKEVTALYEKIEKDPRHSHCIFLFGLLKDARIYQNWDMGYKDLDDMDIKFVNTILSWNKLIRGTGEIGNNLILEMLTSFKSKL